MIKKFASDTFVYGIGSSLQKFISFLLIPLFTYYITPREYGIITILGTISMVLMPIFTLGFSSAIGILYFKSRSIDKKDCVISTSFFVLFVSSVFMFILCIAFTQTILNAVSLDQQQKNIFLLSVLSSAVSIISTPFLLKLQFLQKSRAYVGINLLSTIVSAVVGIVLVVYAKYGALGFIVSQLIGNVFVFIYLLFVVLKSSSMRFSFKIQKDLLRFGVPLVPSFIFLFVLMHSNKYILQYMDGLNILGVYSIGFSFGSVMSILTSAVVTAWFPFFMSYINRQSEAKMLFANMLTYYIYIVGFICVLFFIFAKPLLHIVVSQNFYGAYIVVGYVAMAYFILGIFNMLLPSVYFSNKVAYVTYIQFVSAVLALPLSYLFVRYFGLLGMGLSLVVGHGLMVVVQIFFVRIFRFFQIAHQSKHDLAFIAYMAVVAYCNTFVVYKGSVYEIGINGILILIGIFMLAIVLKDDMLKLSLKRRLKN